MKVGENVGNKSNQLAAHRAVHVVKEAELFVWFMLDHSFLKRVNER
jgi:hypothetical protein